VLDAAFHGVRREQAGCQTLALTVSDKPRFSPPNSPIVVAIYLGSTQIPIVVTGYPTPVLTVTESGGSRHRQ
jgi:hypothetical protein